MSSVSLRERAMSRSIASLEEEFRDNYYVLIKEFNCNLVRGQMWITQWPSKYFILSFEALGEAHFKKMEKHTSLFEGGTSLHLDTVAKNSLAFPLLPSLSCFLKAAA